MHWMLWVVLGIFAFVLIQMFIVPLFKKSSVFRGGSGGSGSGGSGSGRRPK